MTAISTFEELLASDREHECGGFGRDKLCIRLVGIARLPTQFGEFQIAAFWNNRDSKEHVAIIKGNVLHEEGVPTRIHSECLTGDALGSLRCDCRPQLESALTRIGALDRGLVLYLRQEGRGIGLLNKIRAYQLQDQGLDTVEANLALGFRDDERDYAIAAHMLGTLRVRSIKLMTNNPNKVQQMRELGVRVVERIPHVTVPTAHNRFYLKTKATRSGHLMVIPDAAVEPPEQD